MEQIIEEALSEENDPLEVLDKFNDEPIDIKESFDLIIPTLDPSEHGDSIEDIV